MKPLSSLICLLFIFTSLGCHSQIKTSTINNPKSKAQKNIHPNNPYYSRTDTTSLRDVPLSKWKKILSPHIYSIAFEKGTDKRYKGYWNSDKKGIYYCGVCGNKLFVSTAKFSSTCGWPSFFEPVKGAVEYNHDDRYGMHRIEVICKRCGAHLGHVFDDGPPPTGLRFCMNSSVLDFVPDNSINFSTNKRTSLNYKQIISKINHH